MSKINLRTRINVGSTNGANGRESLHGYMPQGPSQTKTSSGKIACDRESSSK